jgi:hypothetical protein
MLLRLKDFRLKDNTESSQPDSFQPVFLLIAFLPGFHNFFNIESLGFNTIKDM